jgi:ABC-2 type transport system permease protein
VTVARILWAGFVMNMKGLSVNAFYLMVSVVQPIIFASLSFFLFQAGARPGSLLYVALGAGLMGIWSSTLFGSGGAINFMRWQGTLELSVAAPPPMVQVMAPITLATSAIGLYSVAATLVWGRIFFGVPLHFEHPFWFAVALPATVLALGMLGLVLAASFVRYRHANALSNLLEYPVWLVSGLLVPLSLLPGWATPLSWLIAPTWGIRAVREAALGGDPRFEILMCLALAAVYTVLGTLLLTWFERLSREQATLALV